MSSRNQQQKNRAAGIGLWLQGARPRTLLLAVSPVVLGTGSAQLAESFQPLLALLCLLLALGLQVGVNYANDYSDGVRGTDADRVGPARLTASGVVPAAAVKRAAVVSFGLSALIGLILVVLTQLWWLLVVGAFALFAAWTYTGGRNPYGYRGLGEVVVFVFFGLIATTGTAAIQIGAVPWESWLSGSAVGFFASAVLLENNLRDRERDQAAGKNTLAVKLGDRGSRIMILVFLLAPYLLLGFLSMLFVWAPLVFVGLILTIPIAVIVMTARTPKELVTALQLTSLNSLVFALGLAAAIAL